MRVLSELDVKLIIDTQKSKRKSYRLNHVYSISFNKQSVQKNNNNRNYLTILFRKREYALFNFK